MKFNTRLAIQLLILESYLVYQIGYIIMSHTEFLVLCFRLAEFQYLINQVQQPDGTLMDDRYLLGIFIGK